MRYWIYDEEGMLFRKFATRDKAEKFLQPGWTLMVRAKEKPVAPTTETHGEALW